MYLMIGRGPDNHHTVLNCAIGVMILVISGSLDVENVHFCEGIHNSSKI
jgi:hypothetical protein